MNRNKILKTTTDSRTYNIINTWEEPYWDDGIVYHKSKGWRNQSKTKWFKEKMKYEVRMYRTWKYNRKTQWKSK